MKKEEPYVAVYIRMRITIECLECGLKGDWPLSTADYIRARTTFERGSQSKKYVGFNVMRKERFLFIIHFQIDNTVEIT